jgi:phage anti-repressor protein
MILQRGGYVQTTTMSIVSFTSNNNIEAFEDITNPYIKKVFECAFNNLTPLSIKDFIRHSGYPIDSFMVDNFFHNLNDDIPIYITPELIEWCGFVGTHTHQKESFNKIVKQFIENEDYWAYTNKLYNDFYNESKSTVLDIETFRYPNPIEFKGKNKMKHLVLTIPCFKMVLMMLNTKKAHIVRKYYIGLEKLIQTYAKYQIYQQTFQNRIMTIANKELRESDIKHKETIVRLENTLVEMKEVVEVNQEILAEVNGRLITATDERAPRTSSVDKRDKFTIVRINDEHSHWTHYAVRVQHVSLRRTLLKVKTMYPDYTELVSIPYQPNGVNFYNLLREKLEHSNISASGNKIRLLDGYTEEMFVRDVNELNLARRDVDNDEFDE